MRNVMRWLGRIVLALILAAVIVGGMSVSTIFTLLLLPSLLRLGEPARVSRLPIRVDETEPVDLRQVS